MPSTYPALQAKSLAAGSPSKERCRTLFAGQTSRFKRYGTLATVEHPAPVSSSNPPFLRHPILFGANSLELSPAGENTLKRAVAWLRQHPETRILIVGSCDVSGSEICTHALAEARGGVIQTFLGSCGVDSAQIVGVKGWDNLHKGCRNSDVGCQQSNRSARIFIARSVAP
jgi:outer membrane protein OmpA-like peptidoglycan-associated protein